ncbi:MAG TPA: hypothetical protein VGW38_21100, partial [Chloroflexota bacterium]|nr:hypothetical protein [Chloroflexota bacterium]
SPVRPNLERAGDRWDTVTQSGSLGAKSRFFNKLPSSGNQWVASAPRAYGNQDQGLILGLIA